uniref:Clade I nitrous oxide reductase n=1 Tax=Mesocestoides corti TaxID=53468 RepID=A0A5K3EZ84_MESCO
SHTTRTTRPRTAATSLTAHRPRHTRLHPQATQHDNPQKTTRRLFVTSTTRRDMHRSHLQPLVGTSTDSATASL